MSICVVRCDKGVSCLPVHNPRHYYVGKYDVITFVNKNWNIHYVRIIQNYFKEI